MKDMTYWLNIHDPDPIGHDDDYKVYLKKVHKNTARLHIKSGDLAVIYEIGWKLGDCVIGTDGKPWPLKEGRKGIIAIVELGNFIDKQYEYNGTQYIGWSEVKRVIRNSEFGPLISLKRLREIWSSHLGLTFSPRINGGLRLLSSEEWQVISKSVGK